ncbi:uncharacterized protein RSE6_11081 [Rhynchosporium secalis]|uniref:2EXR domain-containing protein n=1 Tax=Rhynchosporium secalis TaxID=38038 RepID=A0A1E1MM32_RHYSE|nr:uncharacterized protein RSE6_11081 [Rhynchosporium secalis]
MACAEPRIIDLRAFDLKRKYPFEYTYPLHPLHSSSQRPYASRTQAEQLPSIFLVFREAHDVALKHYTKGFGTSFEEQIDSETPPTTQIMSPNHIWVNWDCDIICLIALDDENLRLAPCFAKVLDLREIIVYPSLFREELREIDDRNRSKQRIDFRLVDLKQDAPHPTSSIIPTEFKSMYDRATVMKTAAEKLIASYDHQRYTGPRGSFTSFLTSAMTGGTRELRNAKIVLRSLEFHTKEETGLISRKAIYAKAHACNLARRYPLYLG